MIRSKQKRNDPVAIPGMAEAESMKETLAEDENREKVKKSKRDRKSKQGKNGKNGKQSKPCLPPEQRPVIYRPGDAIGSAGEKWRYAGLLCRVGVLFFAVFAMGLFLRDACGFYAVGADFFALISAVWVLSFAAALLLPYGYAAPIVTLGAGAVYVLVRYGAGFIWRAFVTMYNVFLTNMADLGYYAMLLRVVPLPESAIPDAVYLKLSVAVLLLIIAAADVLPLARKTRIWVPLCFNSGLVIVVFVYNITRTNWDIALLIASFAALLVMAVYDRLYQPGKKRGRLFDDATVLYDGVETRPALPQGMEERERAFRHGKKDKAAGGRKRSRRAVRTVEEELDRYMTVRKKPAKVREKKAKLTPAEKAAKMAADKAARREKRQAVRRVADFDRRRRDEGLAASGFTAMAVFAVCFLLLCIPAASVQHNFRIISAINKPMELYRQYVTAILQGNDPILDDMGYAADKANFAPRSTDATPRYYTGEKIMDVEANASAALYLRGWTGVDYQNGSWLAADDETFEEYRRLFGTSFDPSESMLYGFYQFMAPGDIPLDDSFVYEHTDRFISRMGDGYLVEQVNIRRYAEIGTLCYFPSYYNRSLGLRQYGTAEASPLTYVNYYDGIYTGHRFKEDTSYATVSFVTTMKTEGWYRKLSERIAAYETAKARIEEALTNGYQYMEDQEGQQVESDGEYMTVTYTDAGGRIWRDTYRVEGRELTEHLLIQDPRGSMRDLYTAYFYQMTDEEREQLRYQFRIDNYYTNFVYSHYTTAPSSQVLRDTMESILKEMENRDAESGSEELLWTAEPATRGSGNAQVYETRHRLVMAIIDYLSEHYEYTLTPMGETDPALDGVENFLSVTKEGYCVQFASATALLLRMACIPARYVDGYIVPSLLRNYEPDARNRYYGSVYDYDAHAWVEVWYDGIGWVPYETTPAYYNSMYPVTGEGTGTVIRPYLPGHIGDDTDEGLSDEELEALLRELEEQERLERLRRRIAMGAVVLLLVAAVAVTLAVLSRRARKAQERREALAVRLSEGRGDEGQRRADALAIIDMLTELLALYGSAPKTGETRSEYAARLSLEYSDILGRPAAELDDADTPTQAPSPFDLPAIFDAIAAEEFGGYMSPEQMAQCARLWVALYGGASKRLRRGRRWLLRLLYHKL